MAAYVALLRAVNLGPHGKVSMPALKELCEGLGFGDVRTLLNSGNVIFTAGSVPAAELEDRLEVEARKRLQLATDFFVRGGTDWEDIVAGNPFPEEAEADPSHLLVVALKDAPAPAAVEALQAAIAGPEVVRGGARHVYISYPAGIGTSKLTMPIIERKLGTRGTGRNWNTVLKLAQLAGL